MEIDQGVRVLLTEAGLKAPDGLRAVGLFHPTAFERSSFSQFLLESRILPAQRLQVLHTLGLEREFLIGYTTVTLKRHSDDMRSESDPPAIVEEVGPHVLSTRFIGEDIFETVLAGFHIAQIVAQNLVKPKLEREVGITNKEDEDRHVTESGETIILTEPFVILTADTVFTDDPELASRVKDALAAHITDFEALLQNQGLGVPHALYTGEFLRWFPGHVRIRTLSDLRE